MCPTASCYSILGRCIASRDEPERGQGCGRYWLNSEVGLLRHKRRTASNVEPNEMHGIDSCSE